MISKLTRFFDDVHRLTNFLLANTMNETLVILSQQDRDLLANFHRRKPKKTPTAA